MFNSDPFKGKMWAIASAVPGMSHVDVSKALQKRGARLSNTLTQRVDALVSAGYTHDKKSGFSDKELKARQYNIPIVNEAQFLALLRGETASEVEALGHAPEDNPKISLDDALTRLRGMAHEEPSYQVWQKTCKLLDQCSDEDLPMALDYIEGHLDRWPEVYAMEWGARVQQHQWRHLPAAWRRDMLAGRDNPRLRLVRIINLNSTRAPASAEPQALLGAKSLNRARMIDLGRNRPSAELLRALRSAKHLASLTHFYMGDMTLTEAACAALAGPATWSATHLSLRSANIESNGLAVALGGECWTHLRELNLHQQRQRNACPAQALADARHIAHLETLLLDYNEISATGLKALMSTDQLANLRELNLYGCRLGPAHIDALTEAHHLTHLRRLKLGELTTATQMNDLMNAAHLEGLQTLSFDARNNNGVTALAASSLRPRELSITQNLTEENVAALLGSRALEKVERLNLNMNFRSHELNLRLGCMFLSHRSMQGVTSLNMSSVPIDNAVLKILLHEGQHLGQLQRLGLNYYKPRHISQEILDAVINAPHLNAELRQQLQRSASTDHNRH